MVTSAHARRRTARERTRASLLVRAGLLSDQVGGLVVDAGAAVVGAEDVVAAWVVGVCVVGGAGVLGGAWVVGGVRVVVGEGRDVGVVEAGGVW
jgi:hypothetical protein